MQGADLADVGAQLDDGAADAVDAGEEVLLRVHGVGVAVADWRGGWLGVVRGLGDGRDPVAGGCWSLEALRWL